MRRTDESSEPVGKLSLLRTAGQHEWHITVAKPWASRETCSEANDAYTWMHAEPAFSRCYVPARCSALLATDQSVSEGIASAVLAAALRPAKLWYLEQYAVHASQ